MSETSESIPCQGTGYAPCPWAAYADVTVICPAGQLLADCNGCARWLYDQAPSLYEVQPLFMWGDPYDTAREFAGLPPAPPAPPLPAPANLMIAQGQQYAAAPQQGGIRGLLSRYLGWRQTPDGQLAETVALTGLAWEWHEHQKARQKETMASAMGWTRAEREHETWKHRHPDQPW
jgi:hypothetical protein